MGESGGPLTDGIPVIPGINAGGTPALPGSWETKGRPTGILWRLSWWLIPLGPLAGVLGVALNYLTAPISAGEIARGVRAADVDLSALKPEEARQKLSRSLPSLQKSAVTVQAAHHSLQTSAAHLGARWDLQTAVVSAMAVGRERDQWHSIRSMVEAVHKGRHFQVPIVVKRPELVAALAPLARSVYVRPHNAGIALVDSDSTEEDILDRIPARPGVRLDMAGSARKIGSALTTHPGAGQLTIELPLFQTKPRITDQVLAPIDGVVGEYTTQYRSWQRGRTHNLWLASTAINGALVLPGEVFSYNHRVGQRRPSRGYQSAPIFLKGKVVEDTGGGVCQVATTVYNAALLANCRIVERNHHSMRTTYSRPGRDATVAWDGDLDLKFKNSRETPIFLTTAIGGGSLTVRVWGHKHPGEHVQVFTREGPGGIVTYRVVYRSDGVVHRQVVSRDPYPAIPRE